ncbi:MAG: hypothetical protein WA183_18630, partial [Chthoniobacterales bacterium]
IITYPTNRAGSSGHSSKFLLQHKEFFTEDRKGHEDFFKQKLAKETKVRNLLASKFQILFFRSWRLCVLA